MSSTTATKFRRRESVTDKADRLIAEERYESIRVAADGGFWVGTCQGDHGRYAVFAISPEFMERHNIEGGRVGCNCRYGGFGRLCSHAIGAEQIRKENE